jgi:hypothetical protein
MAFWAAAAPAIIGAVAGSLGSSGQSVTSTRNVAPAGANELYAGQAQMDILKQLQGFSGAGPGQQDISNAYGAQNDLAAMLRQFSQGGYGPTEADQLTARSQLAPQFEQVRQNQVVANQQFRQQAATSGRGPMDFAFTNRLNQNTGNQMNMLAAQQSQLAAQQPMQRLGFMQDFTNLKQGLATQAMQNRLAISSLGSSIQNAGMQERLGSAGTTQTQSGSGGGLQGALMGGLAGAGVGASLMNKFGGGSSVAQPSASSPWDGVQASGGLAGLIGMQGNAGSSYGGGGSRGIASMSMPMQMQAAPSIPSFLNPATAYQQNQSYTNSNLVQGMPSFLQRGF